MAKEYIEREAAIKASDGRRHAGARGRVAGNDMNIKQMKFRKIAENTQLKEEEQ